MQYRHGCRNGGEDPQGPTGRHIGVECDKPYDRDGCRDCEHSMQAYGSDVGVDVDRPIDTERGVLLGGNKEARGSEDVKGQALRPPWFSDGGRHVPSAHQETEYARGRQDESEGGIHWHEFLRDLESGPAWEGWWFAR